MEYLKKSHETRILELIFRNGPLSRTTISEETSINSATVTNIIKSLIDNGMIQILGEDYNKSKLTPGRKQILIDINANFAYTIGVEFNEKQICFCLTNLRGSVISQRTFTTTQFEIDNITNFIIENIEELISKNQKIKNKIIGIGIAIPGKLDTETDKLLEESGTWKFFEPQKIRQKFDLPVIMDNNIKCTAYGYYLFTPQQTPETFSFFHVGTGIYCSNMRNGDLFADENYIVGEIGHTIVNISGKKCECGKYGCLQTCASERWLLKAAKLLLENRGSLILRNIVGSEKITMEHIITAYKLGDELVEKIVNDAIKYLSMSISNLFVMMNPTKIFLHGRLFDEKVISSRLYTYIEQDLTFLGRNYSSYIEIIPCKALDGAIGASAEAIRSFFIVQ